ncbi:MAG: LPXTG cell wall anchor domain-containing protein [Ruminococcus sp.]|nr:LPXTG cell wall anchor domain-containing protein [Ruminococcus sp.]
MKTTKKIFAALLAVMMLAMMVPFTASAAEYTEDETYSYSLTGNPDYTYTVYKVASVNPMTMTFGDYASDAVKNALINKNDDNGIDSAALLAACDALDVTGMAAYQTAKGNVVKTKAAPAVYYVKTTANATTKTIANSVFAVPYYVPAEGRTTSFSATIASKVTDDNPNVDKIFSDYPSMDSITEYMNKPINYTISGSIVGDKDNKMLKYSLVDTMSAGLDFDNFTSVYLLNADGGKTALGADDYTSTYSNHVLTVTLTSAELAKDSLYDNTTVVAEYVAHLNDNAIIGNVDPTNNNTVKLEYTNSFNVDKELPGPTLKVYTFAFELIKTDKETATPLPNAVYTLKSTDGSYVKDLTTDAEGKASVKGLKAGKYTLQEKTAPAGYALDYTVYDVEIKADGTGSESGKYSVTVSDAPLFVPATGGNGTMVFTIVGLGLIACAGVLLLVVKKRNSAK